MEQIPYPSDLQPSSQPNDILLHHDHSFPSEFKKQTSIHWRPFDDWMNDPNGPDQDYIWFLCAKRYMETQTLSNDTDTDTDTDERNWSENHPIIKFWSLLWQAMSCAYMNALLPDPDAKGEMYIFCGLSTVKITTTESSNTALANYEDKILKGRMKIIDQWQSLKAAGFTRISAVLPNPDNPNKAWFFKDKEFINVSWESGFKNDVLLEGPTQITNGWKSLKTAGFELVSAFVPNAQFPDQPWAFSGNKCVRISISADIILSGPFLIPEGWTENPLD